MCIMLRQHLFAGKTGWLMSGLNPIRDLIGNSPAFIRQGAGSSSPFCKWGPRQVVNTYSDFFVFISSLTAFLGLIAGNQYDKR